MCFTDKRVFKELQIYNYKIIMKNNHKKNLIVAIIFVIVLSSCNKGKYPIYGIYGITVSYPELTASETLSAIRTERNNPAAVTDTAFSMVLDEYNSYTAFVEFQDESHDIVLVVGGDMYRDTVSDIEIIKDTDKKKKGNDVRYRWNGVACDSRKQVVKSGKTQ